MYLQKIINLLIVNLQKRAIHIKPNSLSILLLKDIMHGPGNDPRKILIPLHIINEGNLLLALIPFHNILPIIPKHCIRLTGACLSIGKYCQVETLEDFWDVGVELLEDLGLGLEGG